MTHTFLLNDVKLVGDFVELKAAFVDEETRLLVVLGHHPGFDGRSMLEIPHQLAVAGELQDAVLCIRP